MADRQKILVVDDTPANLMVLGEELEGDYEIFVATSGETALEMVATEQPDLVLLDIMMPGMDGYEVCRRLKKDKHSARIPIIFITAMTGEEDETRGLEAGAVDYITKPFRLPIIRARVRTHLELKRNNDLLEDLANRDGLTGIYNRRQFDETLTSEWRRAARRGTPLSLILFDIDHFKLYNDNYGHQAGDNCLRQVAQTAKTALLRAGDVLARYGGEEFVVVLPETDQNEAAHVARRIHRAVADLVVEHRFSPVSDRLTISAGVATITPDQSIASDKRDKSPREDTSSAVLVEQADKELYAAKSAGRNRVHP